jgi:hypothetical protein
MRPIVCAYAEFVRSIVFEKTVATFGTFALLYTVTETFILPYTNPTPEQSFARTLLDLALPFMLAYLLLFYIVFGAFRRDTAPQRAMP